MGPWTSVSNPPSPISVCSTPGSATPTAAAAATADKFTPRAQAGALGVCSGASDWSGNWLNWATTSRIDALRKVFYGGHRDTDTTTETILRRSYIPQDAHSWAKEYTSVSVDGYDIGDYTPLSLPNANRRHFFGNLTATAGVNCGTIGNCSDRPPLLARRSEQQPTRLELGLHRAPGTQGRRSRGGRAGPITRSEFKSAPRPSPTAANAIRTTH